MDNLLNNTDSENLPGLPEFLTKEQKEVHQESSFSRLELASKIASDSMIEQSVNPSSLLRLDPYSEELSKYLNNLSDDSFIQLRKDIESGIVTIEVTSLFKNRINANSCPGNRKVMLLLESVNKGEIANQRRTIIEGIKEKFNGNEDLALKLIEKLEKSAEEDPCTFELVRIINDFNENEIKKYNESLEEGEEHIESLDSGITLTTSASILELNRIKLKAEKDELEQKLYSLPESDEEQRVLQEELLLLEQKEKQTHKALIKANTLKERDVTSILSMQKEGKSNQEITAFLRTQNKELDEAMKEFEKQEKPTKKEPGEKPKEENNDTNPSDDSDFYETNSPEQYGDSYRLPLEDGGYIEITEEEANAITTPEAANNLVEFKETLDELKMGKMWDYRIHIFKAITGLGFSFEDSDYLKENEVKIFLSTIVESITPELVEKGDVIPPTDKLNLEDYANVIKRLMQYKAISTSSGESCLETIFIDKFGYREEGPGKFNFAKFDESIKK